MRLIQLEILNLASLDRPGGETISFETGALKESTIFSIVGPTGSGKSTILDAICLALYNKAPRYPRVKNDRNSLQIFGEPDQEEKQRLQATDARNILTRDKNYGYSKLTFRANDGSIYRAEWHVEKKRINYKNAVTLLYRISFRQYGSPVETPDDWASLPRIIGLEYEQFLRTVLIAQGSFSDFIQAKEKDRFQLLEKLIGAEELYTGIAVRIKAAKDEAVKAFNEIAAGFSAREKDLISRESLPAVKERIGQLETLERQVKEELQILTDQLAWYAARDAHLEAVSKYEKALEEAKRLLDEFRSNSERLALHDSTLEGVRLYTERKAASAKAAEIEEGLKRLGKAISAKEAEVKRETEVELARLKQEAAKASQTLDEARPHILEGRKIKTELESLTKEAQEKENARAAAENASKKADKALEDNQKTIIDAENLLQKLRLAHDALLEGIASGGKRVREVAENEGKLFEAVNSRLQSCDATALQQKKEEADKVLADLKTAVRVRKDLADKASRRKADKERQERLLKRNDEISGELKTIQTDGLSDEIDTLKKTHTLLTSENWELHRENLTEGEPCPLCGATHHPYSDRSAVAPVADNLMEMIRKKETELKAQRVRRQRLEKEQAENGGLLEALKSNLAALDKETGTLDREWADIHALHPDWSTDPETLSTMKPQAEKAVADTASALKDYNELVSLVEAHRRKKEKADNALKNFEKEAEEKKKQSEKNITEATTKLETEKGKSENLKAQQAEKSEALKAAIQACDSVNARIASKKETLRQETGDRDPDAWEKLLSEARAAADKGVADKTEAIGKLREDLNELKGRETALKTRKESEESVSKQKGDELSGWLELFNEDKETPVAEETLAMLSEAADDWEAMRATQKKLSEGHTAAATTLRNEKEALAAHQEKKPEREREQLQARKTELEALKHDELIELKARLQRHENAEKELGTMLDRKREAEALKTDWEEINSAIGKDGETMRQIAQCYTLRFLIEHANAEIRKFNSRYELVHVKNSLGIRVIDHDRADDVRDTTSLSGGETFIVSLGLALGLSSLSSRNISFDNLFIDEGFGTLDPDTLATVIDSLAMLQSSQGKKVGVISHTDTMSERITTQIRVIKNGSSGSSRIEIYP